MTHATGVQRGFSHLTPMMRSAACVAPTQSVQEVQVCGRSRASGTVRHSQSRCTGGLID
jgi:hypothetical protein